MKTEALKFKFIQYGSKIAVCLALLVMVMGAYTRLSDAGLGCPDWPGCYGKLFIERVKTTEGADALSFSGASDLRKANTEMFHRYAAGCLALLIISLSSLILWERRKNKQFPLLLPILLLSLLFFQAALGMWTVTWKLLPVVVMGHLLGGMLIASTLVILALRFTQLRSFYLPQWRIGLLLGILVLFLQIALGGWVSSNYAGLACVGFPKCNGSWLPSLAGLKEGFHLFSPIGLSYQGGLLDINARISIHFIHRLWALFTFVYLLSLACMMLLKIPYASIKKLSLLVIALLFLQCTLGIINVVYMLPLWASVAHHAVAALLLLALLTLFFLTQEKPSSC